jgi:two-component system, chemotaxis family, protein-glutamate methylesterase/glutaminase
MAGFANSCVLGWSVSMIRVLIVDDSQVVRSQLAHILAAEPEIRVIGSVSNGKTALAFLKEQKPDVITMDLLMPEMDGFETTRRIMETTPLPIIVVSAMWDPSAVSMTFKALESGAIAVLAKPPGLGDPKYEEAAAEFIAAVKQMSEVKVIRRWPKGRPATTVPLAAHPRSVPKIEIVALGASTGGPLAIQQFLARLPAVLPLPILVVQHMARGFTRGFADWLNTTSPVPVRLATDCVTPSKGCVYVAPDDLQMGVADGRITLTDDPPEHHLRPSASYLFRSVAEAYGSAAAGILLTGMGTDGAAELKLIKDAGGVTFAQDKESSVVHGMPGEAIRRGAADHVLPPESIATTLLDMLRAQHHGEHARDELLRPDTMTLGRTADE